MKRFRLIRTRGSDGSDLIAEGVEWSDGAVQARRYDGLLLSYIDRESMLRDPWLPAISLVWIDAEHEPKPGAPSDPTPVTRADLADREYIDREVKREQPPFRFTAPSWAGIDAWLEQLAKKIDAAPPGAWLFINTPTATRHDGDKGLVWQALTDEQRAAWERLAFACAKRFQDAASRFNRAWHDSRMEAWRERNNAGDCGRVANELISYIDEELVPVQASSPVGRATEAARSEHVPPKSAMIHETTRVGCPACGDLIARLAAQVLVVGVRSSGAVCAGCGIHHTVERTRDELLNQVHDDAMRAITGTPPNSISASSVIHGFSETDLVELHDAMLAAVRKRETGKLPSERRKEILSEDLAKLPVHALPGAMPAVSNEEQLIWRVLDERLGRAP